MPIPSVEPAEAETLRILMISDVYFPRVNGVSTSIQTFRRELHALGHEVTLIVPDYGVDHGDDDDGIIRIPSRQVLFDPEDRLMRRGAIIDLLPRLKAEQYDLVHIQTPFVAHYLGLRLAQELNAPVVESYHTFFEEYLFHYIPFLPRPWLRAAARRFSRWQCNSVDSVVVPSSAMLEVLRAYGVRSEAAIIPTGIELAEFSHGDGAAFRQQHGIPAGRPLLVFVGRVAFEKNIDFLLRMLVRVRQDVPEVLLVIAGQGPAVAHLRTLTERLGLQEHVRFIGYLARGGELQGCYAAGDIFVFASRTETQGLVLLEAMALGVPVVSTAVMGTRDVLHAGEGAIIAPEDEGGFAGAVTTLLRNRERREALGVAARHYAAGWAAPRLAQKLADHYADTVAACLERRETATAPAQLEY
ncbi:MAG: glycosyl transferase family 1 [Gammaproteobacteria bacterium HGW-Gammaproteobacteria-1]|jgi:glycosyltransferase involved in cell wall biosynthesis|nr:MAG: glycosyl transferase family 1 [Gammaproteobacteria bacterium HGW-Gammaproteobacteria-1]